MNTPLVSVVIPTYNYGRFVCTAVDSALSQTFQPLEVIVVDDGSTDDTRERLSQYGDHIRYIYQVNKHLSAARTTGIRAARGEFIALLDSDDLWAPEKLARQVALLLQYPELGAVGTEKFCIDINGNRLPDMDATDGGVEFVELSLRDFLEFSPLCPSATMMRRRCFDEVGCFDETLRSVEDMEMWLRVRARYPVFKLTAKLTGFRVHPTSMSTMAESMFRNHLKVLDKAFGTIPELQQHGAWRRTAEARMYREVAWMQYAAGDRWSACTDLLRSVLRWHGALRDGRGRKRPLARAKALVCYCMSRRRTAS